MYRIQFPYAREAAHAGLCRGLGFEQISGSNQCTPYSCVYKRRKLAVRIFEPAGVRSNVATRAIK